MRSPTSTEPHDDLRRAAPLAWELVIAPLVLVGYPAVAGGLGWRAAFTFVPDLSLAVAVVAGIAALSGLARAVRLVRTSSAANANMSQHPTFSATDPSVTTEVITPDTTRPTVSVRQQP